MFFGERTSDDTSKRPQKSPAETADPAPFDEATKPGTLSSRLPSIPGLTPGVNAEARRKQVTQRRSDPFAILPTNPAIIRPDQGNEALLASELVLNQVVKQLLCGEVPKNYCEIRNYSAPSA